MKIELSKKCIRKLMVISSQESKRTEIMNGNLTQILMFSDMVKRELKTVPPWLYTQNDMKINSQKLPLSRRLLKTIRQ